MVAALAAAVGVLTLLTVMPGPDMAVVTRAAVTGGRRQASHVAVGIVSGLLIWGVLAVAGLAAVLAASAAAFTVIKVAGAVYLVVLGLQTLWCSRGSTARAEAEPDPPARRGDWQTGFVSNILNPKIAIFYTSLLPQLVPAGAPTTATLFGLVVVHIVITTLWLNGYAAMIDRSRSAFDRPVIRRTLERITGTLLIGFGLKLATESR